MTLLKGDPTGVGGYRLESRLGAGGMGVVYRAYSASGQTVALKVIRRQWAEDPEFRARFELEVAAARMVHSKHTVPITDADPYAPDPWMASPYIQGESLADRVREHGLLNEQELRSLAQALLGGLRDIHRAGMVHRDLKPGNVLLSEHGPLIIDFGVSRAVDGNPLTTAGQIVGTPAFMAPEQFTAPSQAGPAADVFSLGCVLVFAATGHSPFDAGSPYASAHRSMHEETDLGGLPDSLRDMVAACLRKAPDERPTPEELLRALTSGPRRSTASRILMHALRSVMTRSLNRRVPAWLMMFAILASAAAGIATAAAWPSTPAPTGWSPWETTLPGKPDPQRCSGYGDIYCVASNGTVVRIDHTDGHIAWTNEVPSAAHTTDEAFVLGDAAGMVFVVRNRRSNDDLLPSRLYALDAGTGRPRWARLLPSPFFPYELSGSPSWLTAQLVRETKTLYIADLGRHEIEAVDVATRRTRWKRSLAPSEAFHATSEGLYATRTTWEHRSRHTVITSVDPRTGRTAWATTKTGILGFAAAVPGGLYLAEAQERVGWPPYVANVVRLDARTRAVVRVPVPRGFASVLPTDPGDPWEFADGYGVADRSTFYLRGAGFKGTGCNFIAVDTETKRIRWHRGPGQPGDRWHRGPGLPGDAGTPVLVGTQLLCLSARGQVIAQDTGTGEELWRTHPRGPKPIRVASGPVMVVNGNLYAVSPRNTVFAVDTNPSPSGRAH
ncbi:protein kinase domain-containing protein [Streptomyces sp. NPDC004059]